MDHLKGKVILISGGAHGQGAAEAAYSPRKEPGLSSRMCLSRRVATFARTPGNGRDAPVTAIRRA